MTDNIMSGHVECRDIDKFLQKLKKIKKHINNINSYKYNLKKVKHHFLFVNVYHII